MTGIDGRTSLLYFLFSLVELDGSRFGHFLIQHVGLERWRLHAGLRSGFPRRGWIVAVVVLLGGWILWCHDDGFQILSNRSVGHDYFDFNNRFCGKDPWLTSFSKTATLVGLVGMNGVENGLFAVTKE